MLRIWSHLLKKSLRILTGKKDLQIKLERLQIVRIWRYLGRGYIESTLYKRFLNKISRKIKQLLAKLRSLGQVHFPLTFLFVLTLASDIVVLYGNDAFSILVLSTRKQYPNSLKKVFVFQKIYFKVGVLKALKFSTDCHIKTCRSLERRAVQKIRSTLFRRVYALSVAFKMKPLRKSVFQC